MSLLSMSFQDGLATCIALAAAAILLRRVFGFARSSSDQACAHCSAAPVKPSAQSSGAQPGTTVFPLTLVRVTDGTVRPASAKR